MRKLVFVLFLLVTILAKAQYYTISTIPYNPGPFTGNSILLDENSYSQGIPIGFSFCFYGRILDTCAIGSNGVIVFDIPDIPAIDNCNWQIYDITLPSPWSGLAPLWGVFAPWQDLDPSLGGNITHHISGIAPNRIFTVTFDSIPMESCSKTFTGQVKLFETTNIIETHIEHKDTCTNWNHGRAAHGLEGPPIDPMPNPPASYGDFVPNRNYPNCVWTTSNEGMRFFPNVNVCQPLSVNNYNTDLNLNIYPNPATTTLTIVGVTGSTVAEIFDISSKLLLSKQLNTNQIDISSLAKGLYFIKLSTAEGSVVRKFVKE